MSGWQERLASFHHGEHHNGNIQVKTFPLYVKWTETNAKLLLSRDDIKTKR